MLEELSAPILRKDADPLNEGYRNVICLEEMGSDRIDKSWALLQASVRTETVPTRKALQSKITPAAGVTITAMLLFIKSYPTNLGTLLAAMLQYQKVSMTIITFDMQLFIQAEQLVHLRPGLKGKFILRIGELFLGHCKVY